MNENELNEIISAFTGNLKDDIDTFFSIEKKYNCSPDAIQYSTNASVSSSPK